MMENCGFKAPIKIGEGGFGKVYRAQNYDDSEVAIKYIATKEELSRRAVHNEIEAMGRLTGCENIAKYKRHIILEDDQCPGLRHYFLIMNLYETTLWKIICNARHCEEDKYLHDQVHKTGIPREEIALWICQIAQALKYIHDKKIIHRDVKPANIFLDRNSTAVLGDFGSGRLLERTREFCGTFCGTFEYLAPEVFGAVGRYDGEKIRSYTTSADLWALGATLLELLTTFNTPLDGQYYSSQRIRRVGEHFATELVYYEGQLCFVRAEPRNSTMTKSIWSMLEPSGLFKIAFELLEMNQDLRLKSHQLVEKLDSRIKRDKVIKLSKKDFTLYKTVQCGTYGVPQAKFWLHSGSRGLNVRLQHFENLNFAVREKEINKLKDQMMASMESTRWHNRLGIRLPAMVNLGGQGVRRPMPHESGSNRSSATSSNRTTEEGFLCGLWRRNNLPNLFG